VASFEQVVSTESLFSNQKSAEQVRRRSNAAVNDQKGARCFPLPFSEIIRLL
jgi:hypothetical protein